MLTFRLPSTRHEERLGEKNTTVQKRFFFDGYGMLFVIGCLPEKRKLFEWCSSDNTTVEPFVISKVIECCTERFFEVLSTNDSYETTNLGAKKPRLTSSKQS